MHADPPLDRRLEPVRFLAGTETRPRILAALADGPVSRATLDAELEVPRTTLRRNLAALAERHWVVHDPETDEYRLTPAGRRAHEGFRRALGEVATADRVGAFLREFPPDLPVTQASLDALTVSVATDRDPHGPAAWIRSHFDGTDRVRGFLPSANPMYVTGVLDLVAGGWGFELAAGERLFAALGRDFPDDLATLRAAESVSLSVLPDPPEYGVALFDDHAFLVAYDDRLRSHSVARVPRSESRLWEWADDRYASVVAEAVPLSEWTE